MSEDVKQMFAKIAKDYDKMNNLFTFNMHNTWKKRLVKYSGANRGFKILDCASGTGDLAILFSKIAGNEGIVYATDFCNDMLQYVKPKAMEFGLNIKVELADVMNLQYEDDYFDITSISYGVRNVDDTNLALKEMARVTKPKGKIAILETGIPNKTLMPFYNIVTKGFMPMMGQIITQDKSAYAYLHNTASEYPYGKEFVNIMKNTNVFSEIKIYKQFFGASYIYIGTII